MLHSDPPPTAYYPYWQRVPGGVALVVRTTADPHTAAGALRAALRSEDAQLPIQAIRTMEEVVDRSVAQRRFQLTLMGVFAAVRAAGGQPWHLRRCLVLGGPPPE